MKNGNDRPVNSVAARVVSRGESFDYHVDEKHADSELPLSIRQPTDLELCLPGFLNLVGVKFGRLIVLGISAETKARWVCKCVCGYYVLRTAKAIKAGAKGSCCNRCKLLANAKSAEYFRRTGKRVNSEDFL
ncbi:hypothetical protein [Pseudomonas sp. MWU12-3103b]|uniref:hypothetical protein n=1 Tax=Pseudomonas sp. MWU12-3103b TaxID=2928857 RepID=UPI001FFF00D3|nr:hypothetical protein [Pseudomonas sp. MWU12-3103b]